MSKTNAKISPYIDYFGLAFRAYDAALKLTTLTTSLCQHAGGVTTFDFSEPGSWVVFDSGYNTAMLSA